MNEIILLKLGELVLKGLNRRSFEDKLQANIHRRLHPYGQFRVYTRQSATYVEPKDDSCDVRGAYEAVSYTHLDVYKRQHRGPESRRCDRGAHLPCAAR